MPVTRFTREPMLEEVVYRYLFDVELTMGQEDFDTRRAMVKAALLGHEHDFMSATDADLVERARACVWR